MKNHLFAAKLNNYVGKPYVYAMLGQVLTQTLINDIRNRYPSVVSAAYAEKAKKFIGQQCFDCSGLIKYVGIWEMGDKFDGKKYVAATDMSANGLINYCKNVQKYDKTIVPPVGAILWKSGTSFSHVGVYVGNGQDIQAKGIDYGVIKEPVNNTTWEKWGLLPEIDYEEKATEHWAKPYYEYLVNAGVIANDENSRKTWANFDDKMGSVTIGNYIAMTAKSLGYKPK